MSLGLLSSLLSPQSSVFALAFVCPLAFSWLLTACLIRWAPRLGLVDYPSARKFHTHPTPRGGGLAIFLAFAATSLLFWAVLLPPSASGWQLLLSPLIVALGLFDDLRPLPWQLRLAVQAAVAVAAVLLCLPPLAWPLRALAVVWVVGMVNAFNMLDNMDALSAGVAWVAAGFLVLAVVLQRAGGMGTPAESVLPLLMLMGALSGFLWFNAPPARIFMGDAGSTFLGFFLALSALEAALRPGGPPWAGAVPLCVCAVPCYDLVSVVLIRLRQGRSPFEADKQHLSHRLVGRGFSPPGAVRLIYLLGAAGGVSGLLLYAVGTWAGAALVLVQLAAWWAALAVIEYVTRERPAPEPPRGDKTERM